MRLLVVSKGGKHLPPPELVLVLVDAMGAWQSKYADKMEQIWAFAGTQGGGGILNVESLEELDAIMGEFPFGPFSEVEILPLTDLGASLQRTKERIAAMAGGA